MEYPTSVGGSKVVVLQDTTFDQQTASNGDTVLEVSLGSPTAIHCVQLCIQRLETNAGGTAASANFSAGFQYVPGGNYIDTNMWQLVQTATDAQYGIAGTISIADLNSGATVTGSTDIVYRLHPFLGHSPDAAAGPTEPTDVATTVTVPTIITGFRIVYAEADDFTAGQWRFVPYAVLS